MTSSQTMLNEHLSSKLASESLVDRERSEMSMKVEDVVSTDILIIGTGPAGASLACFLASHGLGGIMISSESSSTDAPRAHLVSRAALGNEATSRSICL